MSQLSCVNPLSHHELLQLCNIRSQCRVPRYYPLTNRRGRLPTPKSKARKYFRKSAEPLELTQPPMCI